MLFWMNAKLENWNLFSPILAEPQNAFFLLIESLFIEYCYLDLDKIK